MESDRQAYVPRCAYCTVGTVYAFHKFSCGIEFRSLLQYPLPKRNPGLAIRNPARARWPEVAHAKRTQQYRHPRST